MKQKRCIILIDGSNFYFKLKDLNLHHLLSFDFSGFVKILGAGNQVIHANYYIGAVRTDGTSHVQKMFNDQRKLFAHLKKHKFGYSLGYLLKSGGKFHEKGVEAGVAVGVVAGVEVGPGNVPQAGWPQAG